jgi:hypothetical protein
MLSFLAVGSLSSFVPEKIEENIPVVEIEEIVVSEPPKAHQLDELIEAIGQLESNNRYDVVNPYGFMGKYQFSPRTVAYLGYDVTREQFLNNPELQDSVMVSYLRSNYSSLQHHIMVYGYTIHNGVYITPSSVLAGAHFAGARGMKRFLENNVDGKIYRLRIKSRGSIIW